jgi:NAD(P)-dependent dehydrogenase (short-subunit alcohol dehydrogenase family)
VCCPPPVEGGSLSATSDNCAPAVLADERPRSIVPALAAAVVVGGSRGIGLEVGRLLGKVGFRVLLASRSARALTEAVHELTGTGVDAKGVAADASSPRGAEHIYQAFDEQWGTVPSVLVYAAGVFGPIGTVATAPLDEWRSVIDTNLLGAFYSTRLWLPRMLAAGWGRIIYISSKAALGGPGGGGSAYAISKIGLNRLMLEVATEVAGRGVTANSIHPGDVRTDMWADISDKALRAGRAGDSMARWSVEVARTGGDPVTLGAEMVLWLVAHPEVNGKFLLPDEWQAHRDRRGS